MSLSPRCAVRDVPPKGLGVVALEDISPGTTILVEEPLLRRKWCDIRSDTTLQDEFDSLPFSTRSALLTLNDNFEPRSLLTLWVSNSLPLGDGEKGVCLVGSRFNHACLPNVHYFWSPESRAVKFRVVQPVQAGQELCISYGNIYEPRDSRQAFLARVFKFDCHCEVCSLSGQKKILSDLRRKKFLELNSTSSCFGSDKPIFRSMLNNAEKCLSIAAQEFPDPDTLAELHLNCFRLAITACDISLATDHINEAVRLRQIAEGSGPRLQALMRYQRNPRCCSLFRA